MYSIMHKMACGESRPVYLCNLQLIGLGMGFCVAPAISGLSL